LQPLLPQKHAGHSFAMDASMLRISLGNSPIEGMSK